MKRVILLITLAVCLLGTSSAFASDISLDLSPAKIDIGVFYHGMPIKVSGKLPASGDVVVRFVGVPEKLHMKKKAKALGLFWMNMDSLEFDNAPNVFLVLSGKPLNQLGEAAAALGLEGLVERIEVAPANDDSGNMIHELIKLKQSEKLYAESTGKIAKGTGESGMVEFSTELQVPSRLTPGEYKVEVYVIDGGAVVDQGEQTVSVKLTGLPKFISNLAMGHGALFGVLSVVAAILLGLIIGLVFQGGSKGAH